MCIYSPMPHTLSYCALIGKCALIRSNTVLYICTKFCQSISKSFGVTDTNSRDDTKVVINVDRKMQGQMDGQPDPYIAPCLRQARRKLCSKRFYKTLVEKLGFFFTD